MTFSFCGTLRAHSSPAIQQPNQQYKKQLHIPKRLGVIWCLAWKCAAQFTTVQLAGRMTKEKKRRKKSCIKPPKWVYCGVIKEFLMPFHRPWCIPHPPPALSAKEKETERKSNRWSLMCYGTYNTCADFLVLGRLEQILYQYELPVVGQFTSPGCLGPLPFL